VEQLKAQSSESIWLAVVQRWSVHGKSAVKGLCWADMQGAAMGRRALMAARLKSWTYHGHVAIRSGLGPWGLLLFQLVDCTGPDGNSAGSE
jgi:hypothetical protein